VRQAGVRRERKEKKGGALRRGTPLIAARGGGRGRQTQWVGTAVEKVVKPWVDKAAATVQTWVAWRRRCSDHVADERGPRGFIFSQIIQIGSNMEIENGCLTLLQKFQSFACRYIGAL
jgi:hypothetical protein